MSWTPQTLYEFVSERAGTRGDAEALVTTTARLTYRDQHRSRAPRRQVDARARHRNAATTSASCMGNDETWVTLFYAAATIGAVTVPVNTRFKSAELAFCLAQADVKALFIADRFLNIDFLPMLRAAEPAIDARSRRGAAGAGARRRNRQEVPQPGRSCDDFLALGDGISGHRRSMRSPPRCAPTTSC